jgi:peptidoglycan glycosyltransferase
MRAQLQFYLQRIPLYVAIVLLIYGMAQPPEQESTWLLCLWLAAVPISVVALRQIPLVLRVNDTQRALQSLTIVLAVGFGMLSLQVLRHQVVWSKYIADAVIVNEATGETSSNVRHLFASVRVNRGAILDREGQAVVETVVGPDGRTSRTYPVDQPAAFAPVVGVVNPRYGASGIEASYADYLTGNRNAFGQFFRMFNADAGRGDTVQLTIHRGLQQRLYPLMGDRVGAIVVLDPATGAVLALVSTPSYDPYLLTVDVNADRQADQARMDANWQRLIDPAAQQPLLNRAIQGRYPPGSTFKLVTAVAALDAAGIAEPDSITCPETFESEVGAPPVVNAVPRLYERTGNPASFRSVIAFSCNTAFAQYALRLGPSRLVASAEKMGFVTPERPDEAIVMRDLAMSPSLLYVDEGFLDRPAGLADTGFGQGQLLVTPMQMAMVGALIANDGVLVEPYLVEKVMRPSGAEIYQHQANPVRRAMPAVNARRMREAMQYAVKEGFGKAANAVPGVNVGGKSGTAEYGSDATHAWFVAIAPVETPRFAVAVIVEAGGEGSSVGAQLAGETLLATFETLGGLP